MYLLFHVSVILYPPVLLSLSFYLSVFYLYLSLYLSVFLSISIYLSVSIIYFSCLCISLFYFLSLYISILLPVDLSPSLSKIFDTEQERILKIGVDPQISIDLLILV